MPERGKLVVGLTGGIATGKSEALKAFKTLGAAVVDCDVLAHRAIALGGPARKAVIREFGTAERKALGPVVFASPAKRKRLGELVHPHVRRAMFERVKRSKKRVVVCDVPLLFESKLEDKFDLTLLVYAPEKVQLDRLRKRGGLTAQEARLRVGAQLGVEKKKERADLVVRNTGTLPALRREIREFYGAFDLIARGSTHKR